MPLVLIMKMLVNILIDMGMDQSLSMLESTVAKVVKLERVKPKSTFVPIDERIVCFAFLPSQGVSIFGNFAQHNLLVGYDLKKEVISFKPTDCSKH